MATPVELYAAEITAGFQRFRALLFTITLFCALLLSNAYIERFSFDEQQVRFAELLRTTLEKEREQLRPNAARAIEVSALSARIQRIDNTLKAYKLREVELPIIGLKVSANDVNVIVGIFVVALAAWLLMSLRQLQLMLEDTSFRADAGPLLPALRHATVILYAPPGGGFVSLVVLAVLMLPPVTLGLVAFQDVLSIVEYDRKSHLSEMFGTLFARAMLLVGMFSFLIYVSAQLLVVRAALTDFFYPARKT